MSHSFQFQIDRDDAGRRVDDFLASRLGGLTRMRIAHLIEAGACVVNGTVAPAGYRFVKGDVAEIAFEDGAPTAMTPENLPLDIVHEDDHILVVVKSTGLLVHPTMSVKSGTLANALAYHLNRSRIEDRGWIEGRGSSIEDRGPRESENSESTTLNPPSSILNPRPVTRPGLVHRLDRATSGLMVVAKTPRALTILSRHFRKGLVEKRYLALVHGRVSGVGGTISAPIGRDSDQQPHWGVTDGGKRAETRFRVLERLSQATLLELEPVTGRTNQLRIHCAHIGHAIVGDEMYGKLRIADVGLFDRDLESNDPFAIQASRSETRLCLHASRLAFHHPANGEWMEFTSPLPIDIAAVVDGAR